MNRYKIALAAVLLLGSSAAMAAPFTLMNGDNDGFGFGDALVPDGADLLNIDLPEDRRSAAEAASTDGSQQTDFYSANFTPLPDPFDIIFDLAGLTLNSAAFEVDMGGFQATTFGQFAVSYNGVAQANLFNFQDGPFATMVRSFALDAATIAAANLAGEFRVTVASSGSGDGIAFDYFKLSGDADASSVPEPGALLLLGLGIAGLGFARRRRRA